MNRWYVWTMDEPAVEVVDKTGGVRRVQNTLQTDARPKRIGKGLYQLMQFYIGTEAAGVANGWKLEHFRGTVAGDVANMLPYYEQEAKGPGPLWAGAAKQVVSIIKALPPDKAMTKLREIARATRPMTISSTYAGAANDLARIIRKHKAGGAA